ncbi:FAD/NAD(P)-binding domain-containing protein [Daedalea quercina L-15889]|uniref:FAD/NAD(P)-binding domain-containing protein n=1 Tax=Daedalea quercina L-15889 TaxID=1314783 RepID=A0A165N6X8_9APHY|nr:FAD/NAD(P)-binding domain-containing protein [Daedalea quercina L-15889]
MPCEVPEQHIPTVDDEFRLGDFSIDEYKPIKVVCIGAGFSGIIAGIRFPQRIPNVQVTIYDKNAGIGGTWFSNKYPGLACDIPAHCYQLTFEPKTDWSAFYAPGPEIRSYLQSVVDKYKLMRYIKLQHRVVHALYDEPSGKWHLRIRRRLNLDAQPPSAPPPNTASPSSDTEEGYEEFEDTADILFTGVGSLSRWKWPEIDGLKAFEGKLFHTADFEVGDGNKTWQEATHNWRDKRIGVIGVGSSAIQIVPALQPRVQKIVNFVRGRTWISTPFSGAKMAELMERDPEAENYVFTEADKERFKDTTYYKQFRHELESDLNSVHPSTIKDSSAQRAGRAAFHAHMIKKLVKKPWIADFLIPEFGVACRRLTAGPGYLEALCADNVDFQPTHINRITSTGIELVDGTHEPLDIIICATGYDYSFQLDFPVVGRNGVTIQEKWSPHPSTYLAVCADGFPNWFMSLGPNSGVGSGSLLVLIERQVEYVAAAARKMQRERLKSIEVKKEAVEDFDEYLEHYFPNTVYSEKCRSWYKMGKEEGRVVALWPGSCLHAVRALEYPRWEDFQYELPDGIKNRMHWLGDGQTYNEKTMTGDRAWYLNDDQLDMPPVPAE